MSCERVKICCTRANTMSAMEFKRGDIVAWHGAGPYVYDHQVPSPVNYSQITAPDGSPRLARDINLTPYQPTEYEDTGRVECEHKIHEWSHLLSKYCVNPVPLYRRVHVCGPFEERFVAGKFGTCVTPHLHHHPHEVVDTCESWHPLGTMESVCTVCGVTK